jgi:hypothetical protein
MKADTYARLLSLEALIDAEVGYWLERHPQRTDRYRETLVARVSDLVDEIDALDAVAAARVYDAVVDFLAELPDDDEGLMAAALRFKRSIDRMVDRAMRPRDLDDPATWAVVLDELLEDLLEESSRAAPGPEGADPRASLRARLLLARAREAAGRLAPAVRPERREELRDGMDRLGFVLHSRPLDRRELEPMVRTPQRLARRYRPSSVTRIGTFVVEQLLRPRGSRGGRNPDAGERG